MLSEIRKILFDRIETVGDIGDVDALTMEHAAVQLNDLFQQLLRQHACSTLRELLVKKVNNELLQDHNLLPSQVLTNTVKIMTLTSVIKMIDELLPVA